MLVTNGTPQSVSIGEFTTEAGVTIDASITYQAWGTFRGSNVILVEHALTGDSNAVEWWGDVIGPGKALDTDHFCVVCTNVLGGCKGSTGPSSLRSDGTAWGSRFPAISIRDQVNAEAALLDVLGISRLHAVVGGSMGGARTLEWTLLYPARVDAACVIAVSARASAWQIGIQTAQISAIERDPNWQGGDYYDAAPPTAGLAAARRIAHLTYRGELEIDERFGTTAQRGENPLGPYRDPNQRFAVQSYLDYQGLKLTERFDAGSYVALTESLNRHDIGRDRGGLNKALAAIQVPTMIVGVDTDILYPYHQQEHLSRNVGNLLAMAKISSPVGHDAFLTESRQMDRILRHFIELADGVRDAGIEYHL
ncbi:homoserine O-acetyltransferase [Corynebacterium sp. 153RC1]|uniref:homoserine O-acetyltransferase MetX n=1 Tax=unclassified Corynebacterium TaxID=2624378 RepID=UPI00211C2FF4|nr:MULTISPECIES: homoserine O-acetyltransferase [unclassified Corynebacterium]MCQ9369978.1 homoserine O-acetyltransferase [Corynebacterium sp. 35RC1]MCQ9352179.1 homoserine O-acetyltransferase [Corynebacterium sp. 209RC1]MCQ9354182.1 homoserine O-acetyltransferase [Corynebacterium sp. 1222RC1]MCQ9356462.1 homoserine O-acetyltransferase [Corynebacterium sp. 122RC1]MCQ9358564.1 homoserine O-acetyltransferase [Corynebacterium sp. 142RC1]